MIENLYDLYRPDFLSWAGRRFLATPGDIEDGWQDAVVIFYENVLSGKITEIEKCNLKTFLFAIGNNKLLKNYERKKRLLLPGNLDKILQEHAQNMKFDFDDALEEKRERLRAGMDQLSPRCSELLIQRYYHQKDITELKEIFQYASENTVSVTINKCIEKLEKILRNNRKGG